MKKHLSVLLALAMLGALCVGALGDALEGAPQEAPAPQEGPVLELDFAAPEIPEAEDAEDAAPAEVYAEAAEAEVEESAPLALPAPELAAGAPEEAGDLGSETAAPDPAPEALAEGTGSGEDDGRVRAVRVFSAEGRYTLPARGHLRLYAALEPADALLQTVYWTSSDESAATVSTDGVVTFKPISRPRVVEIEARAADDMGAKGGVELTLYPATEALSFARGDRAILPEEIVELGETAAFDAGVEPANAMPGILYESSDPAVAAVTPVPEGFVVEGLQPGVATIRYASMDGLVSGSFAVRVQVTMETFSLPETLEVGLGKTVSVPRTVTPEDATRKVFTWRSDNKKAAAVDQNGKVKGVKQGTAMITAAPADGSGLAARQVTVKVLPAVTKVTISGPATLPVGGTARLKRSVAPAKASKAVSWKSSNAAVASVDESGVVTAHAPGKVKLTAKARDGSGKKSAALTLTVVEPVTGIAVSGLERVAVKGAVKLKAAVSGGTAEDPRAPTGKAVAWKSSNPKVATVDKNGKVVGVKQGQATITATAKDGFGAKGTFKIEVVAAPRRVAVMPATLTFDLDENAAPDPVALTAEVSGPVTAVRWTSSDPEVAAVDPDTGAVTARAGGVATITATVQDGSGKKASAKVSVLSAVQALSLSAATDEVAVGKTLQLKATFVPARVYNSGIEWNSSDKKVATVDKNGKVKAVARGEAVITATARGGAGVTATYTVNVKPITTRLTLSAPSTLVPPDAGADQPVQLQLAVKPAAASKRVSWSSGNTAIATVNADGLVTIKAGAVGSVKITAKARDGSGVKASITLQVQRRAESVALTGNASDGKLYVGVGKKVSVDRSVLPGDVTDPSLTWTSSNPKVATVDKNGKVKGVKAGQATITARAKDGSGQSDSIQVVVQAAATAVTIRRDGVAQKQGATLYLYAPEETLELTAGTAPAKAFDGVAWSSDNQYAATVDAEGRVRAVGSGAATITAKARDGSGKSAAVRVVVGAPAEGIEIMGLHAVAAGQSIRLTARVSPGEAVDKSVIWSTSDPGVATVEDGVVTGVAAGRAVITARATGAPAAERPSASFVVDVSSALERLDIVCADEVVTGRYLEIFTSWRTPAIQLSVRATPRSASAAVVWETLNPQVATVDENGVVTARGRGTTQVIATATDGSGKSARALITVYETDIQVRVEGEYDHLAHGRQLQLRASLEPHNRFFHAVDWASSDPDLAEVDADGRVTANADGRTGRVVITAAARAGTGQYGEYPLEIVTPITSVTVNGGQAARIDFNSAETTLRLPLEIEPEGHPAGVRWSSEYPAVATVDENGVVTGVASGITRIFARAAEGSDVYGYCDVDVARLAQTVTVEAERTLLFPGETLALTAVVAPEEIDLPGVTWDSSDENLATVDEDGLVTVADSVEGAAVVTITAASADGNAKDSVELTIASPTYMGFVWSVNDGEDTVTITGYTGAETRLRVPEAIEGRPVVAIGPGAFENRAEIETIRLPDAVKIIGARAFAGCAGLREMSGY